MYERLKQLHIKKERVVKMEETNNTKTLNEALEKIADQFVTADMAEIAPFLFFAVPFCLILIIYNLADNAKAGKKIKHMEKMRRCEKVRGEIVEFSERPVILGKEFGPEKIKRNEYGHPNYKAKNLGYRIIVNYEHPVSGEKKQAVSELYSWFSLNQYEKRKEGKLFGDFKKCVREDVADVYVSEDGETWVDVICL